ncbi:MAG: hypothetical protein IMY73_01975 [Bacteroidetes bacterium]|nr:hypothetical protein [Bacteroidota bacterium]
MKIILVVIIIYQIGVIYFLGKGRLWGEQKSCEGKSTKIVDLSYSKKSSVMGKTKTQIYQIDTNESKYNSIEKNDNKNITIVESEEEKKENYSKVVEGDEYSEVFTNVPLDVEIEAEYQENQIDEIIEEDDIVCSTDDKDVYVAKGLSYDDLEKVVDSIKGKSLENSSQINANISALQGTEVIEQINKYDPLISSTIDDVIKKNSPQKERRKDLDEKYLNFNSNEIE